MEIFKVDVIFIGIGDLFVSLFFVWFYRYFDDLVLVCEIMVLIV